MTDLLHSIRPGLRALALALVLGLAALPAWAQSTPVYQSGKATARDLAKFYSNGLVGDAGGVLGDSAGNGVNPFAVLDNLGIGISAVTANTGGSYQSITLGHDASGNGILDCEAVGTAPTNCNIRAFGTTIASGTSAGLGLLGAPTAPTPPGGNSSTRIATTAFVAGAIAGGINPALPFINATAYNIPAHGSDGTTQAQAALDAAAALAPATVWFPNSIDFTSLATYPGVTIIGGGNGNPWHRTASGPGLYTAADPAHKTYPTTVTYVTSPSFAHLAIEGGGRAGSNLTLAAAANAHLADVSSYNTDSGAASITGTVTAAGVLNVTSITGTISAGQMLICQLCGAPNVTTNTYPTVLAFGTNSTSGIGGLGTYQLSTGFSTPVPAASPGVVSATVTAGGTGYGTSVSGTMTWSGTGCTTNPVLNVSTNGSGVITSVNSVATVGVCQTFPVAGATTWTAGGALSAGSNATFNLISNGGGSPMMLSTPWSWPSSPGNQSFPSANVWLLGLTNVDWVGGGIGGNGGAVPPTGGCSGYNGIGMAFDSVFTDGSGKPNANDISGISDWCNIIGRAVLNGSDNTWKEIVHQNDIIGEIYGTGSGNSIRNITMQGYYEPGTVPGQVAIIFGPNGSDNRIDGVGSLGGNGATFAPIVLDTPGNSNARNEVRIANDQTYRSSRIMYTFFPGFSAGGGPTPPNNASLFIDGPEAKNAEIDIQTYQNGDVPIFSGINQTGTHGNQGAVNAGQMLAFFGGRGQYDTALNHVCDSTISGSAHLPCAGFAILADTGGFSGTSWPTRIEAWTTPTGSQTPVLAGLIDRNQNWILAPSAAIATNATAPFTYLPTSAGVPTGVPAAAAAGRSAVQIDSTNHKICWYESANSAWKCVAGT